MKIFKYCILAFLLALNIACSDEKASDKKTSTGDHVWKQQTDTLKTSKEVAKQLQKNLDQQKKALDETK